MMDRPGWTRLGQTAGWCAAGRSTVPRTSSGPRSAIGTIPTFAAPTSGFESWSPHSFLTLNTEPSDL